MACHHRGGHRVGLDRHRGDHHEDDRLEADRRVHRVPLRDPHVAHHPEARRQHARDEVDDLRAVAALGPADADPVDGPPAWAPTASALRSPTLPLRESPLRSSAPLSSLPLRGLELRARRARAQASPPLRSLPVAHHQTFRSFLCIGLYAGFTLPLTISPILALLCRRDATSR